MKASSTIAILLAFLVVLTACDMAESNEQESNDADPTPASKDQIVNIQWQWADLVETEPAGQSVIPDPENYTVTFLPEGIANIKADCNRVRWPYTMEGSSIMFEALFASTMAACPPGSLTEKFLQYIGSGGTAELQNGRLILNLSADAGSMGFEEGDSANAGAESCVTGNIVTESNQPLPDSAFVQVQIQDVSMADAAAQVIGSQSLETDGAQFPIAYKVCYDPADIDQRFSYSMGVRITDENDKLIFISDTHTPVITDENPTSDVTINVVPVTSP